MSYQKPIEQEVKTKTHEGNFFENLELWTAMPIPKLALAFFDATPCECGKGITKPSNLNLLTGAIFYPEHEDCKLP